MLSFDVLQLKCKIKHIKKYAIITSSPLSSHYFHLVFRSLHSKRNIKYCLERLHDFCWYITYNMCSLLGCIQSFEFLLWLNNYISNLCGQNRLFQIRGRHFVECSILYLLEFSVCVLLNKMYILEPLWYCYFLSLSGIAFEFQQCKFLYQASMQEW